MGHKKQDSKYNTGKYKIIWLTQKDLRVGENLRDEDF